MPGLKKSFVELAKESNFKIKKCKVLGADGKELSAAQDASSFGEVDLFPDEEKDADEQTVGYVLRTDVGETV